MSRAFCLTLNNPTEVEYDQLVAHIQTKVHYAIVGREVGEEGTPHLQVYLYYKNPTKRTMDTWTRLLGTNRYHVEVARGSPTENREYCSKEGNFQEWGVLPVAQNDRYKEVIELLQSGGSVKDAIILHPQIGVTCYKNLKAIRNEFAAERSANEKTALFWFYGPPGSGKSRYAKAIDPDYYKKPAGYWWDETYLQQKVVLMDDFRPSKELPLEELLNLVDYGKHTIPVKGCFRKFNSKIIVITSPHGLRATWSHCEWMREENLLQLERRVTYQCEFPLNALDAACLAERIASVIGIETPVENENAMTPDLV